MTKWIRIPETGPFPLEPFTLRFALSGGAYELTWSASLPHDVFAKHGDERGKWGVEMIETDGAQFRLSGMAYAVPAIDDEACWFELLIDDHPSISYYGNQVLYRRDILAYGEQ